ncbi:fatty acyl-CoA reductase wat-like isoform X1 [Harmonia axyridis]|uniref:fatty acyl-CoA reductase wat-like isoform X1 n=1 Tax=Harmonia axyridis TaxID=115357 RepID=UPI001E27891C|nr:fatty acyl-CoA reductase wat-like isoform X1 [Harmonia axyridis]XP_045468891.1 fatty acyl-CoA reductase wat-like isoform X1 [Harmonia axyridis]XP_045468892.1 fatty acyl-CoA reductase wat-like isoform X1 [Harmonia axyridis]XP_045468893.1 fatty acyl-CoA reductase wat-like isoform X1 [Harmonia axyridis]XP_045468894.1 fatty acyl-CoA reductase wat-like isoform X1 [Harmonia axyridis]
MDIDKVYSKGGEEDENTDIESNISAVFENGTIFLTGATGFLGKMFLEKLLRSSPKLRRIYMLIRPKKGKDVEERLDEIFDGPNMEPLKRKYPRFIEKVSIVNGDCSLPDLGMDEDCKNKLIRETNFIIHCAATVNFDEKLRTAAHINVRVVRDLVTIAKQMKDLKAFLHVSTAFSHCIRSDIGEKCYEAGMAADKLLDFVEEIDEDRLTKMTPILLGEWPNTYVFTKAIAENLVAQEFEKMPIAIIRPGIVIAAVDEPVKGWIDNYYGPTGSIIAAALGWLRTMQGRDKNVTDLVPADYVINAGLAVIWDTVTKRKNRLLIPPDDTEEPIFNIVSSPEAPVTWKEFMKLNVNHAFHVPVTEQIWHNTFLMREGRLHALLACFFLHTFPAYLIDFICICIGRQPKMVKGYQKINKFCEVMTYFALREWKFFNNNIQDLWRRMDPGDKQQYPFSMENFDWDTYFRYYVRGTRVYLLKDPLETVPKGRVLYWKLFFAHYALTAILLLIFFKILYLLCSCIF